MDEHVRAWLLDQRRRNLSPATIEKRESATRRLMTYANTPMLSITRDDIEGWLDSRPSLAPRTRYGEISHVAAFYRWAIIEGVTDHDPTVRVARPKVRNGLPRPIATDDLLRALDQAPTAELTAMLMLASYGGLRCAEISGLTVDNVLDRHDPPVIVVYGKGGRERVVPLHPAVHAALRRHGLPMRGRVFPERPPWRVSHLLRAHLLACGVDASAHQLRHWFATSTYELSGGDLRLVQELLGHSSPTTTAIYTRWSKAKAMQVVAQLGAA